MADKSDQIRIVTTTDWPDFLLVLTGILARPTLPSAMMDADLAGLQTLIGNARKRLREQSGG